MRKLFAVLFLFVSIATAATSRADEIHVISAPASIPITQSQTFTFGSIAQMGNTVLLKISSRIDSLGLAGSSGFLKIELNGHEVLPAKSRTAMRLVNKPLNSPVIPNVSAPWFETRSNSWRVIYAPDFKAALAQKFYTGNPYEIVLDVTDLINPVAENHLTITNTATSVIQKYTKTDAALVIGSLDIETKNVPSVMMATANNFKPIINRGEPAVAAAEYHGKILPGGGFELNAGKSTFTFNSAFSFPNAGFNILNAGAIDKTGQKNWHVNVDTKANRVTAQGDDYRIERSIKFEKTHAEIIDTITNLHKNAPLGMAVRDEISLRGIHNSQIRLAGNPDPAANDYYAPGNPSVHVRLTNSGIGMIAEDDVFRNQALLYTRVDEKNTNPVAGIRTQMLRLAPGETYSLRWAVYPVAGPDYFDFINLVRNDWGSNFTVDGACWWGSSPDQILNLSLENLRETLLKNGIRQVQVTGSWIDHKLDPKDPVAPKILGFGTGVMEPHFADYRRRVRDAVAKIHQAVPGVKVVGYYDVQRDSSENNQRQFADSALVGADGKQLATDWNGLYSLSYNMVPTLQNNFGRSALETAKRYMSDMNLDGIYWDEMEITGYNAPLLSYKVFDGHTCQLDPKTWTIAREVGISALATKQFRLAVINAVKQKDGILFGNGPSGELDELHTQTPHMIEIQHNDDWSYQGNLETPLGFTAGGYDWKNFLRAFNQAMLPITTLPYDSKLQQYGYPHDMMPYVFPFTPIELHAGYLLGQERIITTHSGNYGWSGEKVLSLSHHFDENGKLMDTHFPIKITRQEARTNVDLKDNEAAVLERIPITFAPPSKVLSPAGNATITVNQYDAKSIALNINAPDGGILTIQNGTFILQNNGQISVNLNGKKTMNTTKDRALTIALPRGFNGTCIVTQSQ
jgi:hypothetical protein